MTNNIRTYTGGYILAALSALLYGTIPLFSFPALNAGMTLDSILFYRFTLASLVLLGVLLYKKESIKFSLKDLLPVLTLGILYYGTSFALFWCFDYLTGGIATVIMFLYPIFVAVVMAVFYKEKITYKTMLAIAVALIGVYTLYRGDGHTKISIIGLLLALSSGFIYGAYIIFVNKNKALAKFSGLKTTFYSCLVTSIFFLISALFKGGIEPVSSFNAGANIALLAIISTAMSCLCLAKSVRIIGSTKVSILGALEPVSAVICGALFLNEPITFSLILGVIIIISSTLLAILYK